MKNRWMLGGLILSLLFTASCSEAPSPEPSEDSSPGETTSSNAQTEVAEEIEPIGFDVFDCDSPEVDPLTEVADPEWNSYLPSCPTDRTAPEPALQAMTIGSNLEPCMLVEDNQDRVRYEKGPIPVNTVGFPRQERRWPDGTYKVLVVPVDWPDLKDRLGPLEFLPEEAEMFADWYKTYSRGKVQFEVEVYPEWIELDVTSDMFSQSEYEQNANQWGEGNVAKVHYWWTKALEAADPYIDFTDVSMVMFVAPRFQEVFAEFNLWPDGTKTFETDEGPIKRGFTGGEYHFRAENTLWWFWTHETLHYFAMPDLYWTDLNSFRAQPQTMPAPNYGYDVMTMNMTTRLNSWLLWLLGWVEDQEVVCLTSESFEDGSIEIASNDLNDDRTKAVMIPMNEHQLILIESHRTTKFDFPEVRSLNGVLMHLLDTRIPHGDGAMTLIAPEGRTLIQIEQNGGNRQTLLDGVFYEGNSIDIFGYHITVNESTPTSDIVSISRIPDWQTPLEPSYVCITKENRQRTGIADPLSCPLNF
jgi:M6 family metalloprotease-like protein